MDAMMPPNVLKLQKQMESLGEELQRTHLIPKQKEAFLCCAKCCDNTASLHQVQACVERCSQGPQAAGRSMQTAMQDFQERLQRCAYRCQDLARDAGDEYMGEKKMASCMDECGKELLDRLPKLRSDILSALR
jgi:hypothetical protein